MSNTVECTTSSGGTRRWRDEDGKGHRPDGPATIFINGDCIWLKHGKRHRLDGPAVEYGKIGKGYWVDGVEYIEPLLYWMAVAEWKKTNEY